MKQTLNLDKLFNIEEVDETPYLDLSQPIDQITQPLLICIDKISSTQAFMSGGERQGFQMLKTLFVTLLDPVRSALQNHDEIDFFKFTGDGFLIIIPDATIGSSPKSAWFPWSVIEGMRESAIYRDSSIRIAACFGPARKVNITIKNKGYSDYIGRGVTAVNRLASIKDVDSRLIISPCLANAGYNVFYERGIRLVGLNHTPFILRGHNNTPLVYSPKPKERYEYYYEP